MRSEVGPAPVAPTSDFPTRLDVFPTLKERLACAEHGETLGAWPLRQSVAQRASGRVALVGDANGYVDAVTGEGMDVGLAQA